MERDSARGAIQPGLKILARYFQTGLGFSARPNGLFREGPKKIREHAHRLCFRTAVNFLMEFCVLRPRWNWACNCNNTSANLVPRALFPGFGGWGRGCTSARWAERNFNRGWNSPCNQLWKNLVHQFTKILSVQKITGNFHPFVVSMLCCPQLEIQGHL